jgi:transcriptional regulator with XRE-family HTH domain
MERPMTDLRKIRVSEKRISQFELSQKSGVHPSRISLLENDLAMPSESEVRRISEALGMVPEELFGLDAVVRRLTASRKRENE